MIRNYLTIAYRFLHRHKAITMINVGGLSIGIAACILILFYIQDELNYDRFHENADSIYRLTQEQFDEQGTPGVHRVLIDPPFGPLLKSQFPEVRYAVRLTPVGPSLSYGNKHIDSGSCYWADPDIFEVFSIPLQSGFAKNALEDPFSIVLSASKASALFGEANPLGKTVLINNKDSFTVTGVFNDLPSNTHLPVDVLGSMATLESWFGPLNWDSPNYATYLLLHEGASPERLEEKLAGIITDNLGAETTRKTRLHLQPLLDIHLRSHLIGELAPNGDIQYIYLLSSIAFFILLIAGINFINLTTARSSRRAKEVGMRKVTGARRSDLIIQFLTESILLTFLSITIAVVMVELALPAFNSFTGKALGFQQNSFSSNLVLLVSIGLVLGFMAGSYPAFYLSGFRPAVVLKGLTQPSKPRATLRRILVFTQFVIAVVLLLGTMVIYRQLTYVHDKKLGFDKEHVLVLPTVWDLKEHFDPFRARLLQHPDVLSVSQSNPIPSRRLSWSFDANVELPSSNQNTTTVLYPIFVDEHFFPTYRIPFVAGRNFTDEIASDTKTGFILNQEAIRKLGWSSPDEAINQRLTVGNWQGNILGVVADFHFESLHQQIAPMVFYMDPRNYRLVSIRIKPGTDLPSLVAFLNDQWQQEEPGSPPSFAFLDQYFNEVYEAEERMGKVFATFSVLAFLITCLGLFGMATFVVEQRTKEIGIRKVLGASVSNVVFLLTREFTMLVVFSFSISFPIAYFSLQRWLDAFAYHASFSWWIFALAGGAALGIALLTVSLQSVKAALADPVETLRFE